MYVTDPVIKKFKMKNKDIFYGCNYKFYLVFFKKKSLYHDNCQVVSKSIPFACPYFSAALYYFLIECCDFSVSEH